MRQCLYAFIFIIFISGCAKDSEKVVYAQPAGCDSLTFSYSNHIASIIKSNCNSPACHAAGGAGSYDYTTYAVVADRIRTGRFLDRLLLPLDDPQHMPEDIRMNPCELYRLITWIEQGYPDN